MLELLKEEMVLIDGGSIWSDFREADEYLTDSSTDSSTSRDIEQTKQEIGTAGVAWYSVGGIDIYLDSHTMK